MQKDKNGHLIFIAHRKKINEVYRFTKKNYVSHSLKHQISDAKSLQHIEDTIQDPDCITIGKNKEQKNYYRVVNYQKNKHTRKHPFSCIRRYPKRPHVSRRFHLRYRCGESASL